MMIKFEMVKIFSATMARERARLGDDITRWIKANEHLEVVNTEIKQSSDSEFHCLTIILFIRDNS